MRAILLDKKSYATAKAVLAAGCSMGSASCISDWHRVGSYQHAISALGALEADCSDQIAQLTAPYSFVKGNNDRKGRRHKWNNVKSVVTDDWQ